MKAKEIRELGPADIQARLAELERERFNLRFRGATEAMRLASHKLPVQTRVVTREGAAEGGER